MYRMYRMEYTCVVRRLEEVMECREHLSNK